MSLLEVDRINSFYGDSHILFDVSMRVEEHEVVALLGRNGAGKSTTLKSLMGMVQVKSGTMRHRRAAIQQVPPERGARRPAWSSAKEIRSAQAESRPPACRDFVGVEQGLEVVLAQPPQVRAQHDEEHRGRDCDAAPGVSVPPSSAAHEVKEEGRELDERAVFGQHREAADDAQEHPVRTRLSRSAR
ncbi:hypothetical protein CDEF62S_01593 [Castellaniella defragrans]